MIRTELAPVPSQLDHPRAAPPLELRSAIQLS